MKRTPIILSLILITSLIFFTCNQPGENDPLTEKAKSIVKQMTLEEKAGQMTQITLDVITVGKKRTSSDEPLQLDSSLVLEAFRKYKVGSILNTANNRARTTEKWNSVISYLQKVAIEETGVPVLYGIDAIHGATYTAGATFFPQQIGQGATFNPELVKKLNEITAYEMRASGIPWNFSPVLDMGRDPRDPRMWETYGEAVLLAKRMGAAATEGLQGDHDIIDSNHGAACLKHYLAYNSNSGKDRTPLSISARELIEKHAPGFQAAIDAGARSVMINSGVLNGLSVHANPQILTTLLRDDMGFEGMVVTDWLDIENLHKRDRIARTEKEAVKIAINAGIDMAMVPYDYDFTTNLIELVNEGEVSMERVDEAVTRIIKLKLELGLFENPVTLREDYPEFGSETFINQAKETALESITLLKNNDILPLSGNTKILVCGPNANSMRTLNGGWSYSWQGEKVEEFAGGYNTIYESLINKFGEKNVTLLEGVEYEMEKAYFNDRISGLDKAVKAAKNHDVIIACIGENSYCEKPGDLHDLHLSRNQKNLVKQMAATGKPVILILNQGRPRLIRDIDGLAAAVVNCYLPGNYGGDALAEILAGDYNPNGKLPFTYPMYPNSLLTYDYKPSENQEKPEGIYDYQSELAIQYPFGYGLSYTSYDYHNLKISDHELSDTGEVLISVDVTNTGEMAGKEVVMLFSSDQYASLTPDNKRLIDFTKIELAPNETKTVSFSVSAADLAFVNYNNQWVAEEGSFIMNINMLHDSISLLNTVYFGERYKVEL
ncbi:MAG: beta-glucosidase [Marinilabiliales bacterium]|nr:MAG: beta-glucosidase [Marinilabiliales bacterium]